MREMTKWYLVAALMVAVAGCKHPLGPDEVDTANKPTSTNEPTGFTPVANRGFNNLEEDNWIYGGPSSAYAEMKDDAAPQSKPAIGRITIPQGFGSGQSPLHFERQIKPSDHFYVNMWFRVSDNWEHNQINDGLIALWAGGQPRIYWGWRADSTGQGMHPTVMVSTDEVETNSLWLDPNVVKEATITRGTWHHVEFEVETSAGTSGLGRYVCWLDGTKIASYDNVPFGYLKHGWHWEMLQVGPAWGGETKPIDQSQSIDFDHFYMSGKTL